MIRKNIDVLRLYVDGASRGNPGPAAAGVIIADASGAALAERGFYLGRATNNVAEYRGLLAGLKLAAEFAPRRIEVFADSELMVRQITGQYRVRSPDLLPLFEQAQAALLGFDSWQIRHVPRSQNAAADRMANLALDRKADVEDAGDLSSAGASAEDHGAKQAAPAVEVRVLLGCDPRVCPATVMPGETFRIEATAPAGLCIHAAAPILTKAIEMMACPSGFPGAARVTCPKSGCNARFELSLIVDG